MESLNIPVGVSDFSEICQNNYYYIDKTGLIIRLLNTSATKMNISDLHRRMWTDCWRMPAQWSMPKTSVPGMMVTILGILTFTVPGMC